MLTATATTTPSLLSWLIWFFAISHTTLAFVCPSVVVCSTEQLRQQQSGSLNSHKIPTSAAAASSNGDLRSCPFSAPFPRYRIDLTRSSSKKEDSFSPVSMLFGGFQRAALKQRYERKYGSNNKKNSIPSSFQWIEEQQQKEKPVETEKKKERAQQDDLMEFGDDTHGITAFAVLWEAAAQLSTTEDERQIVIALPDCDKRILLNWKELMDWIQYDDDGMLLDSCVPPDVRIDTTIIEDGQVVRLEARRGGYAVETGDYNDVASSADINQENESLQGDASANDILVEQRTKAWVKRVLVDLQICPFTKSVTKSGQGLGDLGVPVARIAYHTNRNISSKNVYQLLADTWRAIDEMIVQAGPSGKHGISSILLAAPSWDDDWEAWSGPFFSVLEQCVVAARAEPHVGVVCFHPHYATPDGTSWPGFGHMHSVPRLEAWVKEEEKQQQRKRQREVAVATPDAGLDHPEGCPATVSSTDDVAAGGAWQRRTPHATINVLRANQLAVAESRRNTPQLYARNIQTLMKIGNDQLCNDLEQEREMR